MKQKIALITGISGQDGPYLAKFLLDKGYIVYGMMRRVSHEHLDFLKELEIERIHLVEGDLSDSSSIYAILSKIRPDEIYNLAAQSHVGTSFVQPEYTADVTAIGVLRILELLRLHFPKTKFYQASSSEMFGDVVDNKPQNETTELRPRSPYAAAKVFGHNLVKVYRESYGIFACSGMLFNHESPRRGTRFVTRKITDWLAKYKFGQIDAPLKLGALDSKRDWGSAPDYVRGMWMMMQHDKPDDYILATGETHSVREFCDVAFANAGFNINWVGEGINEKGIDLYTGVTLVEIDSDLYRPAEVPLLLGDYSKAKYALGWEPQMKFKQLVEWMVQEDMEKYANSTC